CVRWRYFSTPHYLVLYFYANSCADPWKKDVVFQRMSIHSKRSKKMDRHFTCRDRHQYQLADIYMGSEQWSRHPSQSRILHQPARQHFARHHCFKRRDYETATVFIYSSRYRCPLFDDQLWCISMDFPGSRIFIRTIWIVEKDG